MDRKAILEYLGADWDRTLELIRSTLQSDIGLLNDTNAFILGHSGKQLRPMICLLMAKACGGGMLTDDSVRYAAAVEMLHNATLLHDDVADDGQVRHGAPTVSSVSGPGCSVLVGDYWLVKAVDLVMVSESDMPEIIHLFARTLSDMAEGEMLQLQKASSCDTTEEDYLRIIRSKTSSLFEAACVSAAISVGASDEVKRLALEYAGYLGVAFQIKDDILDYDGENIGKPVGVDIREQKITLPLLGALSKVDVPKQKEMREKVRMINAHPQYADDIVDFVRQYDGIGYAKERLQAFSQKAVDTLGGLPDSQAKSYLADISEFIVSRDI